MKLNYIDARRIFDRREEIIKNYLSNRTMITLSEDALSLLIEMYVKDKITDIADVAIKNGLFTKEFNDYIENSFVNWMNDLTKVFGDSIGKLCSIFGENEGD